MKRITAIMIGIGMAAGVLIGPALGADWEPKHAPLMTRWAKDVTPEKALPEYPRPQMVRPDWQNLNGLWQFAAAQKPDEAAPLGKDLAGRILVPFPVESALSGVMEHHDRLWYRRTFTVPAKWSNQRVLLHFGAVDWQATVWVNGKQLAEHRGGYDPFTLDITDALKQGGEQELVVGVYDPTDAGDQPRGKQVVNPHGIFYTPTTGIWQTVWLEPVPAEHIDALRIVPDVDGKCVHVTANMTPMNSIPTPVKVRVLDGGKEVASKDGTDNAEIVVPLDQAHLWSPEDPHLYDLEVTTRHGDSVKSYFGMRKIAVAKDEKGVNRLMLNGKPLFEVGMLDQGFWPDGIYTAPTDDALKFDIEQQKKFGFNLIRKHVKLEPARWYYWCDKLGMLVWQDMPSGNNKTDEAKKEYETELTHIIQTHWNSPSIIMWVVFNEGWGQFDTPHIVDLAKKLDPSRLVDDASGWTDAKVGNVIDMHRYPGPGCPKTEENRAAVLGEFGGLGLAVPGHLWWEKNFSYSGMASAEALTSQYELLLGRAWDLKDTEGLCACVYTQTTDVEGEINGLMTYDRVVKPDLARVRAANTGQGPRVELQPVVPTAQASAIDWHYTTEKPADDWMKPGFDDAAWKTGPAGFGTEGTPGAVVRTTWNTSDIWIRREIEIPEGLATTQLSLLLHHDDDCEVFVNGLPAARLKGAFADYEEVSMRRPARESLKPGKNLIAIHCHQIGGGQYIDCGIVNVVKKIGSGAR